MIKVVVIGNGSVATSLCRTFEKHSQILLLQNFNRSNQPIRSCGVAVTSDVSKIKSADIYILAIADNAFAEKLNWLPHLDGLVVHTSGATPMEVLNGFDDYGVFYPLQTFSKNVEVDFKKVSLAIEASSKRNLGILNALAQSLTKKVFVLDSEQRKRLHVAAVFANNFTNFMLVQAHDLCLKYTIDFTILEDLIDETFNKIKKTTPRKAQSGPALRNDTKTLQNHLSLLNSEQGEIYNSITKSIIKYYAKKL